MSNKPQETYLGDGVYLRWNGFAHVLYTSDGVQVTNTIVLEPEVLDRFLNVVMVKP